MALVAAAAALVAAAAALVAAAAARAKDVMRVATTVRAGFATTVTFRHAFYVALVVTVVFCNPACRPEFILPALAPVLAAFFVVRNLFAFALAACSSAALKPA